MARNLNPENKYNKGDLRSIELEKEFDAVIATSLASMKNREELISAFKTAYNHLIPGGVLLTFVEVPKESFHQNKTYCYKHKSDDIEILYLENSFEPNPMDTTYELTFVYLIRKKGSLEIHHDNHICGIFVLETWLELLGEIGFDVIVKNVELKVISELEKFSMIICIKPEH